MPTLTITEADDQAKIAGQGFTPYSTVTIATDSGERMTRTKPDGTFRIFTAPTTTATATIAGTEETATATTEG